MYSVLIVDDENYVIEDIKNSVKWGELKISTVYTARNLVQAQKIFQGHDVPIMLCDIEMPGGNGLELLSWVKEHSPKTQTVFLTCHADFVYAKQAIRLGSYDYLLKPVSYEELKTVLTKAVEKIEDEKVKERNESFGEFWLEYQPLLVERFWLDIINREIPPDPGSIRKAADQRNIPFTADVPVTPLLIHIQRWHVEQNLQEEKTMEFGLKNIAEELFIGENRNGLFIQILRGELLGILADQSVSALAGNCDRYIEICSQNLSCDLSAYIGRPILPNGLAEAVERLIERKEANVAYTNKTFQVDGDTDQKATLPDVNMNVWTDMLESGDMEGIVFGVGRYIDQLVRADELNYHMIYQFQQDFSQMIFNSLSKRGIMAHQLFSDKTSIALNIKATHSVDEMMGWIRYMVGKAVQYATEIRKTDTVVSKVQKYLQKNLGKELTREGIANLVYLNPDYLDRIFKKETGNTVSHYITAERIAAAQKMLSQTDVPINVIAEAVGYSKLSNFSAMFKKMCGVTPFVFRKKSRSS